MLFALRPKLFILPIIFLLSYTAHSQKSYPTNYFRAPVDFRMLLAGTFGEIRANHFHSGIDIKTNGTEGAVVYAIADGYVSRIKVSPYGYGNALYITHPNGYVSVYGHLSRYNNKIRDYVRTEQYRRENFEIELFPSAGDFPVKKGDIIAYSGNSGSSAGPHLHFEMRDGASQKTINPLLFGYEVKDFTRPSITSIKIYPENENARINGSGNAIRYLVEGWGTEHRLANNPTIKLSGNISFAIQVYDKQNDADNKNGVYSVALFIDKKLAYQQNMETFSFDETRYVNSLLDYAEYMKSGARMQRTKIDPGNKLSIYSLDEDRGVFLFNDTLHHEITYEVKDVAGNTSTLSFRVKSGKAGIAPVKTENSKFQIPNSKFPVSNFRYNTPNYFNNGSVIVDAPVGSFYDSFTFTYDSTRRLAGTFSVVHQIHDKYTPIQDIITLAIKPHDLPESLRDKALVVKISDNGKDYTSAGGKWASDGYVRTKIREFGNYSISVDTISPDIDPVNPEVFLKMAGQKKMKLIVKDKLSGITSYRGTMNGKWVLLEYDAKNNMLIYTIDEYLVTGRNTFILEVIDGKNNHSIFGATLIR